MTVTGTFRVDIRPYSGFSDPSLPIASYIGQGGLVGDASAGDLFFNFIFQDGDEPRISEMFNLEQYSIDTNSTADIEGALQTLRMDQLAPNRPASPQIWRFVVINIGGLLSPISAIQMRDPMLPLWLGAPNGDEGDKGIRIQMPNNDLEFYAVTLQGYIWGPRSVLADGGPRRPANGFFG